jgi:hypothetical protein
MSENDRSLKIAACAVICNLVLDFSPMRKIIVEKNVISILAKMTNEMDHVTRLNALWAFKNLVYQAEAEVKKSVSRALTFKKLQELMEDSNVDIQAQSLNILRNLTCGKESVFHLILTPSGNSECH